MYNFLLEFFSNGQNNFCCRRAVRSELHEFEFKCPCRYNSLQKKDVAIPLNIAQLMHVDKSNKLFLLFENS